VRIAKDLRSGLRAVVGQRCSCAGVTKGHICKTLSHWWLEHASGPRDFETTAPLASVGMKRESAVPRHPPLKEALQRVTNTG
jgi:hypothetical protein